MICEGLKFQNVNIDSFEQVYQDLFNKISSDKSLKVLKYMSDQVTY